MHADAARAFGETTVAGGETALNRVARIGVEPTRLGTGLGTGKRTFGRRLGNTKNFGKCRASSVSSSLRTG